MSTVHTQMTDVDAGRIIPLGEPRVGDRCYYAAFAVWSF